MRMPLRTACLAELEGMAMIYYESWEEACSYLPEEADRTAFKLAVIEYGCTGKIPDLRGVQMAMFLMAKPLIDANAAKKAAGARGGRPRKDESAPAPPTRRSGKFVNFTPSDTDWDAAASQIMARQ